MLAKLKMWLVVGAGGVAAGLLLMRHFIGMGRKLEQADSLTAGQEQRDAFAEAIRAGHNAGADPSGMPPLESDPYNRANSRAGRE